MSKSVHLIDHGMGNLFSIVRAFHHVGVEPIITSDPECIVHADRVVLPGVGAFAACMEAMKSNDMDQAVQQFVKTGKPILGICLGMQILFEHGTEFGLTEGLGLIQGQVNPLKPCILPDGRKAKIPNIGWLNVEVSSVAEHRSGLMEGITHPIAYYFVHSFMCCPSDPQNTVGTANYGANSICAICRNDNVWGTQFHPERSGKDGLKIYRNFISLNL